MMPRIGTLSLILGAIGAGHAAAQTGDTVTVVPGERYEGGGLKRWVFGSDYRDLWTTPIRVPVLDLTTFAGGLTPVRTGGFGQTSSLHFSGADGRRYVFRSVDKDPSRRLAEELQGTFVESIIQDQIHALNPGAAVVVAPILDAAGVLNTEPVLSVMPDDARLGEFHEEFAGTLGVIMENPDEGVDNTPGFAGSSLISGSERAFRDVENGPDNRFDKTGFLKARLLDVLLGDRDRHMGQWRWARFPQDGGFVWIPIPEDRDQAFIHQDGVVMWATRNFFQRKYVTFGEQYPAIESITWNGWDLDRTILTELEWATWDSVATDLRRRLSDEVIEGAVRQLPASMYAVTGDRLTTVLKARRDGLVDMARAFYLMVGRQAQIHATDVDELATFDWQPDGRTLNVAVRRRGDVDGVPHFRRSFHADETREIRLDLHGGDDRAIVRGQGRGITIRVIGGGGRDELIDRSSGRVFFYDEGNATSFEPGPSTRIDRGDYDPPPSLDPAHAAPPDWGSWTRPIPILSFSPDIGVYAGLGFVHDRYGFRSHPYKSKMWFRVAYATTANLPTAEFDGIFRDLRRGVHAAVRVGLSGIDVIRFYGFGNDTPLLSSSAVRVRHLQTFFRPDLIVDLSSDVHVRVGGELQIADTRDEQGTVLAAAAPIGIGTFGQLGGHASLEIDTRDRAINTSSGVRLQVTGSVFPSVLDVEETFGSVDGSLAAYVSAGDGGPTLAVRGGGRKVWGGFPFYEAAYVGGNGTIRAFPEQRFAGDASVYGNAEARIPIGTVQLIFPTRIGILGLVDAGRVYLDGVPSDTWHVGYGGGLFFSVLGPENTFSIAVASSDERTGLYAAAGFMF